MQTFPDHEPASFQEKVAMPTCKAQRKQGPQSDQKTLTSSKNHASQKVKSSSSIFKSQIYNAFKLYLKVKSLNDFIFLVLILRETATLMQIQKLTEATGSNSCGTSYETVSSTMHEEVPLG